MIFRSLGIYGGRKQTGAAFAPTDVSGLVRWYDGSDESTFTKDASDFVSTWADKGSDGVDLAQGTADGQPQWFSGGYVRFDGVNDQLLADPVDSDKFTWFLVSQQDGSGTSEIIKMNYQSAGSKWSSIAHTNANNVPCGWFDGATKYDYTGQITADSLNLYDYTEDRIALTTDLYVNNVLETDETYGMNNSSSSRKLGLSGRTNSRTTSPFQGDIYQFLVYNRVLTNDEREQVRTYLNDLINIY